MKTETQPDNPKTPIPPALAPIMTETEAARILGTTPKTLQCWRFERRGPKYLKIGRSVRYRQEDLTAFLNAHLVEPEGGRA